MTLTIPTNWRDDFLDSVDLSCVKAVYGKLPSDSVGGGRASAALSPVSKASARAHIREIRSRGIQFNYLLNATCMDNLEFTRSGRKRIRALLDWICESGADTVTLALPQLVALVKQKYPTLAVSVSTNVMVDNLERVRYWEEFGVDQITLSYSDVNRDFAELKRIAEHATCDIQLICNLICRRHCPFQAAHANFHSHASQSGHVSGGLPIDYCCLFCLIRIFSDPSEIMRSGWVRPEDLRVYEDVGIHSFKLVERGLNTPDIARIVGAYTARRYDGDFLDLIPTLSKYRYITEPLTGHLAKRFFSLTKARPFAMLREARKLRELTTRKAFADSFGLHVDNRKLDGFIERFRDQSCRSTVCEECRYCDGYAREAITVLGDDKEREETLALLTGFFEQLTAGDLFEP